ncbi:MAG: hypothetical protein ACLRPR_05585 [Eisenbergiella sp.]
MGKWRGCRVADRWKQEAERLCREGGCVVFVLTGENRGEYAAGVEWCAEAEDGWGKQCGRTLEEQFDPDWLFRVWQRHAGLPWKILETERLILREMTRKIWMPCMKFRERRKADFWIRFAKTGKSSISGYRNISGICTDFMALVSG